MTIPTDLRYTADHEWLKLEDGRARVGITAFAQEQLGDVVYVDVPRAGSSVRAGKPFGVVESVKAVSDLYSPITGTVAEANTRLVDEPELVNQDPYGEGWMLVIDLADPAELDALLDAAAYTALTAEEAGG
jgi:glycine cleavage system H protein